MAMKSENIRSMYQFCCSSHNLVEFCCIFSRRNFACYCEPRTPLTAIDFLMCVCVSDPKVRITKTNRCQKKETAKMDSFEAAERYRQKIGLCYGLDPYTVKTTPKDVPLTVSFSNIYQFLVLDPNPFTDQPKNCTKGMESILYYKNGWVKGITGQQINDIHVVRGVVHHSFALSEKPLRPWILVKSDGSILAAHCDCAIGILEACSHIGATLFALDGVRTAVLEKKLAVTDLPAYWKKPPVSITDNLYQKIRDIDFGQKITRIYPNAPSTLEDTSLRCRDLLSSIQNEGLSVAAMAQYCGESDMGFTCPSCSEDASINQRFEDYNLRLLYDADNKLKSLLLLRQMAIDTFLALRNDPVTLREIEFRTTGQSDSKWWGVFRSGRITASVVKDVCRTNVSNPAKSLLTKICYPERVQFSCSATKYGIKHEETAIKQLYTAVAGIHTNLTKRNCGLFISSEDPCLGASPDAIFNCDCHGVITVEVKCPFSVKDSNDFVEILVKLKDPYVLRDDNGNIVLNTNHKYYYQANMQVHICKASMGYLCIWSPNNSLIFEIKQQQEFWDYNRSKAVFYFKNVILPELTAKIFTE